MADEQIAHEIWIRETEEKIRRLVPWWLQFVVRRLSGYRRRDITDGHIWAGRRV